ncbi:unnamed protein product [Cuscuta epithymum]|uniref:Uncharacterized protein n=1 Tax=Cuscuta epithymum TaxID=186058 RepID=A0AAV0ENB8_9ASTE|nr:unnamed protein product [Cuscuta epithymum]
MLPREDDLAKV